MNHIPTITLLLLGIGIGVNLIQITGKNDRTAYAGIAYSAALIGLLWWGGFFA